MVHVPGDLQCLRETLIPTVKQAESETTIKWRQKGLK